MNYSHPALHGGRPEPSVMFSVPGECKAFILCFIYYALDFAPSESKGIEEEHCLAAVSDILKYEHNLVVQPDHILAYYREAKANAKDHGWDYSMIANFMVGQVVNQGTVKRITSFELHDYTVAKLSQKEDEALKHARQLANTIDLPYLVQSRWNTLKNYSHLRIPNLVDPVLQGKFVETATFPSDTSSKLAAAADRILEESTSSSSEGDAS